MFVSELTLLRYREGNKEILDKKASINDSSYRRSHSLLFRPEIEEGLAGSSSNNNKKRTYWESRRKKEKQNIMAS